MPQEYKYFKALKEKPDVEIKSSSGSLSRLIVKEFIESNEKYGEVPKGEFKTLTALARSLGRALHNSKHGLDPDNKIVVQSDNQNNKVYLIKK
jgi:hypothetical protein